MRHVTPGKSMVWAVLLSWPWVVWFVARYSPEMIIKGLSEATSMWMPILADVVLIAGGIFALNARRKVIGQAAPANHDKPFPPRPHTVVIHDESLRQTLHRSDR